MFCRRILRTANYRKGRPGAITPGQRDIGVWTEQAAAQSEKASREITERLSRRQARNIPGTRKR